MDIQQRIDNLLQVGQAKNAVRILRENIAQIHPV